MKKATLACALTAALALQGCSSKPREFTPTLAAATTDRLAFDADYAACRQLLVDGKLDSSGRLGSGAAGAAAGAGIAAGGAAAASSAGMVGGMAIASATIVAIPFVALAGAWGMSKIKRNKKERAIQTAMAGCLDERGHEIVGWSKKGKKASGGKADGTSK